MEDATPIGEVKSTNGITEDVQGTNRRTGAAAHNLDMGIPRELGTNIDTKVVDGLGTRNSESAMDHVTDSQVGERGAQGCREAARPMEGDKLQLVRVSGEATMEEPIANHLIVLSSSTGGGVKSGAVKVIKSGAST